MNRQKTTTKRIAAVKKSKNLSQPLKHSAKKRAIKQAVRRAQPIHRRMLLHPITIVLLICIGVFIVGWTYRAVADSYSLTAVLHAPPLGEGADITAPITGTVFTSSPITVTGTCPTSSYVKLSRNGTFSGMVFCSNDGTFQIQTDLFSGENVLLAQDYNTTDDPGPATPGITVTYNPPSPPPTQPGPGSSSTSQSSSSSSAPVAPLLLTSSYTYQTFFVNAPFTWQVRVEGGVAPYKITTSWGDSDSSTQTVQAGSSFTISHIYRKQGYYVFFVHVVDASGTSAMLQLAAFVKPSNSSSAIFSSTGTGTPTAPNLWHYLTGSSSWLWFAWPSFATVSLIVGGFWLGERQEYIDLLKKRQLKPR